jgi:putative ubiquitin-RnfH superfamily antitoxin RatB of RatAB toxin-antitoxin module
VRVTVVLAMPGRQQVAEVELPEGATAAEALAASGLAAHLEPDGIAALQLGVWNKPCPADARLRDGDRVEVYRGLNADAKALRRSRVVKPSKRARSGR